VRLETGLVVWFKDGFTSVFTGKSSTFPECFPIYFDLLTLFVS